MDLTTRCPQCGYMFSASLEQLQLRKGYIRCINCAHIFDGFEAVVSGPQQAGAVHSAPPSPPQAPAVPSFAPPSMRPPAAAPVEPSFASPPPRPPAAAPTPEPVAPAFSVAQPPLSRPPAEPSFASPSPRPRATEVPPEPTPHQPFHIPESADDMVDSRHELAPSVVRQRRPVAPDAGPAFTISDAASAKARSDAGHRFHVGSTAPVADEPVISLGGVQAEPRAGSAQHGFYMEPRGVERTGAQGEQGTPHYRPINAIGMWFWRLMVLLGLVLLLAQLAYVYRVQIAAGAPVLRPVLERACKPLGCEVPYTRDISAIAIMSSSLRSLPSLGGGTHGGGGKNAPTAASDTMMLQFILRNTAGKPQEWPTVVLSLKDEAGALVVRKNLPPDTYLPEGTLPAPFAAGSEISVRIPIMLNGQKVNGYQLDKFFE